MTLEEIRKNRPTQATHYSNGKYFKHNGIHWLVWKDDHKSWIGIFIIGELKPIY